MVIGDVIARCASSEALFCGAAGRFSPAGGAELGVDVLGVSAQPVHRHVQPASDLRAAKAFWLSGPALTTPATRLDWGEAAPGQLTVTAGRIQTDASNRALAGHLGDAWNHA